MDIETLLHFQYIAKYKNITKAAKHFYINQSTLSRQLIALEQELGVQLFIRDNKRLELTEAGVVFSRGCDLFIKHMEVIIRDTKSAGKGESGVLRVVTPGNFGNILHQSLDSFKKNFPDTQLLIELYNFSEITSAILYDIYDVGFTYDFATSDNDEIEQIPVAEDDFSIIVSSKIAKEPSEEHIAEIVKSLPLILPTYVEPPFIKLVMYELRTLGGMKNIDTIYLNTSDSVMLQISLGLGYGIVPTSLTHTKMSDDMLTFFPISGFSTKSKIMMLYKKSNPSKLVTSFVDIVKNISKFDTGSFPY
ncbi:LysR family transcriptional regulator [Sinanaerobacter chloroacetimidivorans]|jgi:DNA-binding transcriptional LysR family regulator|uniref:LysR family transcriptional regulator n=1 Tax=Sinanaerobacter chloroacetimidivorans TaxID=2818044 RepID=A0A8J7W1Z9_9FIRM|nr:LysR family transcriptional regulator [Sinanaerobacter chloroacetimidivorans]MBR0597765.1 LysR family transcriptional regulator [Sinanaerobacter chloroacetimidivorans]